MRCDNEKYSKIKQKQKKKQKLSGTRDKNKQRGREEERERERGVERGRESVGAAAEQHNNNTIENTS